MTPYMFVILAFEATIVFIHYSVLGDVIEKTTELEGPVAHALPVLWGLAASLIPLLFFLAFFLFNHIRNDVRAGLSVKPEEASLAISNTTRKLRAPLRALGVVVLVIWIAEVIFFYELLFENNGGLFAKATISWKTVSYAVGLSSAHYAFSAVLMFILYALKGDTIERWLMNRFSAIYQEPATS